MPHYPDTIEADGAMAPDLPAISHLQYLTLGALLSGDRPGRELRETLREFGVRRTRAAFYQFMARLEKSDLVEGWYEQLEVGGQVVTERRYSITTRGRRAWSAARDFYAAVDTLTSPASRRPSRA